MDESVTKEQVAAGRGYEELFVPALFRQWPPHLIRAANISDNSTVLDVACGSGVLAREAKSVSGTKERVVGLDPAPGMIAVAGEIDPSIEWIVGTAENLPFPDDTFDCIVSQFGMMFFQDKSGAASEMFRVTRPGGGLAIAVWNSLENNPVYKDIIAIMDAEVSIEAGDALRLPYSLGEANEVVVLLENAGFASIERVTEIEHARFPSSRTMVEAELRGWLPLFGINLTEDKIADVLALAETRLASYSSDSGELVFPVSAHILSARKAFRE